ncbi:DsrE family protein [Rhodocaloribacter sp.]
MKAAIIVLSDPRSGSEESLGRAFNALAAAYDFKQKGREVILLFQGAGVRWVGELGKAEHPFFDLFEAVKDTVAGISSGCADVFGATEEAERSGFDVLTDNPIPGTSGLPGLQRLVSEGYAILTF